MDLVLFFQSTTRKRCRLKLSGAYRFAREHDWFVQVVESGVKAGDVRRLADGLAALPKPSGVLAAAMIVVANACDQETRPEVESRRSKVETRENISRPAAFLRVP